MVGFGFANPSEKIRRQPDDELTDTNAIENRTLFDNKVAVSCWCSRPNVRSFVCWNHIIPENNATRTQAALLGTLLSKIRG